MFCKLNFTFMAKAILAMLETRKIKRLISCIENSLIECCGVVWSMYPIPHSVTWNGGEMNGSKLPMKY
jgi:hypothetical protein